MSSSLSLSRFLLVLSFGMLAACEWHVVDESHGSNKSGQGSGSGSCGRAGESTCEAPPPPGSCDVKIDRFKELMIIHRSVLLDRRAQNDADDALWSFRARLEELAGSKAAAPALAQAWLEEWKTVTVVGADRAPVIPRPGVTSVLLDPWRARSSGGGATGPLSLTNAPFRLIAIVNRPDLREDANGCGGRGGELRFVYSAVDPATKKAIPMTTIIEIPYPATRSPRAWMDAWHALAKKPFGAEYNDALAAITSEVTRTSKPETWRIRTNEIAFGEVSEPKQDWELREFSLSTTTGSYADQTPRLVQIPMASTPRIELNNSSSLDSWAEENKSRILDGSYVLPGGFQAGSAPVATSSFQWRSSKMPYEVRKALGMATCNGCHGGERMGETSLPFQHIAAPDQKTQYYGSQNDGETRLSSWLDNPGRDDELGRREKSMASALCGTCSGASTSGPGYQP